MRGIFSVAIELARGFRYIRKKLPRMIAFNLLIYYRIILL